MSMVRPFSTGQATCYHESGLFTPATPLIRNVIGRLPAASPCWLRLLPQTDDEFPEVELIRLKQSSSTIMVELLSCFALGLGRRLAGQAYL